MLCHQHKEALLCVCVHACVVLLVNQTTVLGPFQDHYSLCVCVYTYNFMFIHCMCIHIRRYTYNVYIVCVYAERRCNEGPVL